MMRTDELLQRYLAAEADKKAREAEISVLRDALLARGQDVIAADGAAPTWKVPGFGSARIDGYGAEPRVIVDKPQALAEYLAGVDDALVSVSIRVPASQAAEALAAVRDMAMVTDAEIETTLVTEAWDRWRAEHVITVTGPDGEQVAQHVEGLAGEAGELVGRVVQSVLPGTQVIRQPLRLVVTLDSGRKRAAISAAKRQILAELGQSEEIPAMEAPAPIPGPVPDVEGLGVPQLRDACRSAGLPVSGTKAVLRARLAEHLDAKWSMCHPGSELETNTAEVAS
jgi:hypothetical protein